MDEPDVPVLGTLSLGALAPRLTAEASLSLLAEADLTMAAALLARHKVLQLASTRLRSREGVGAELRELTAAGAAAASERASRAEAMLDQLPRIAGAAITVAGMKGVAARRWYAAEGQRDVSDVDLWVPDAAHAGRLYQRLADEYGYVTCPDEFPWFKRGPRGFYGVIMLHPPDDQHLHVDVHFGDYSVGHCASFAVKPGPPVRGVPMLASEDNFCCGVANAAGDQFVDVKSLNDVYLCLHRDDIDWRRVRDTLDQAGLLGFLGVMLGRLDELFVLDDVARSAVRELGTLPTQAPPPWTGTTARERCGATVRHAVTIGRRDSLLQAVRLAWSAYRYYRRPLRPAMRRVQVPFRVRPAPWTCTRLMPVGTVRSLAGRVTARTMHVPERSLTPGIDVLRAPPGDLIRLGEEVFVPTVYYRIGARHAAAAMQITRGQVSPANEGVSNGVSGPRAR